MPECSIVIPAYNRAALTRRCVEALLADPPAVSHEILVVDDASTDGTPGMLAGYGDPVRPVYRDVNDGFAAASNDGAARASGRYLLFLNNDTLPRPGWLDALVRYAEAHPSAAVVGAKLLYPNETVQHAGVVICQDGYPRHLYAGFPSAHPAVNRSRRFQVVTAACCLVRRGAFEELGGFDSAFRNGFEDVDLCLRLGERGGEVHYCHESVLVHLESASERRFRYDRENVRLYRRRWAGCVRPDDLRFYLEDGLMRIGYQDTYPVRMTVSPELALLEGDGREEEVQRVLGLRTRQVADLLRETVRLTVEAAEAGFDTEPARDVLAAVASGSRPALPTSPLPEARSSRPNTVAAERVAYERDEAVLSALLRLQAALAAAGSRSAESGRPVKDPGWPLTPSPYLEYRDSIRRLRETAVRCVPEGSTVLVVSRGDPELLELDGLRAWHFPRTADGSYAGHHPADHSEAIRHLESLRRKGAEYLLIPSTARWWLDHYAGFDRHLERCYRRLPTDGDLCLLFDLRGRVHSQPETGCAKTEAASGRSHASSPR